jgi:hypothetical protein
MESAGPATPADFVADADADADSDSAGCTCPGAPSETCALAPLGKVYVIPLTELALSNVLVGLWDLSDPRSTSSALGCRPCVSSEDGSVGRRGGRGGGAVRSDGRARWLLCLDDDAERFGGGTLGATMGEASVVAV